MLCPDQATCMLAKVHRVGQQRTCFDSAIKRGTKSLVAKEGHCVD